ncbi:unnamed protein product [Effrenium voratum]|nr:unnamed protein product [Effrenium voratum]
MKAAEEALEGAKGSSSTASAELQAASEAVVKAKASAAQTAKAKKAGDAELEQGIATKELLDSALQSFEQLKVGGDAQLFKALEPALKLLPMDKSLRTTVPGVLTKTPDQRGVFDGTVVEELEKRFGLKIAEQAEAVATLRAAAAEKAQQAQEAAEATEAAEEQQKKASDGVCAAKQAQKDAAQAVAKAKEAVTVYKPEFKAATKARDAKQEELQVFTDNGLATFQDLKGRISAKKRKEMKAAEAAKAEEEAAKAEAEAAAAAAEADQAAQAAAATALAEAAAEVLPQAA